MLRKSLLGNDDKVLQSIAMENEESTNNRKRPGEREEEKKHIPRRNKTGQGSEGGLQQHVKKGDDCNITKVAQKIMISSVAERDYSARETCHLRTLHLGTLYPSVWTGCVKCLRG